MVKEIEEKDYLLERDTVLISPIRRDSSGKEITSGEKSKMENWFNS